MGFFKEKVSTFLIFIFNLMKSFKNLMIHKCLNGEQKSISERPFSNLQPRVCVQCSLRFLFWLIEVEPMWSSAVIGFPPLIWLLAHSEMIFFTTVVMGGYLNSALTFLTDVVFPPAEAEWLMILDFYGFYIEPLNVSPNQTKEHFRMCDILVYAILFLFF